jgi:circadian clock protein KaiC
MIKRSQTGISELDEMLKGGFMPRHAIMLAGAAGTGKTTLSLEWIVNGANMFNEPGVYLTFEQMPDMIYQDAASFGWDLKKLEAENKFRLICTSPDVLAEEGGLEAVLADAIKEINPRRIVVDSISHLSMYVDEADLRKVVFRIIRGFKMKGLTPVLLWEAPQVVGGALAITDAGMSFLVDTILLLKFVEIESAMRRGLVVMKMRGSDHDKRLREYEITSQGFKLRASFGQYEGLMTGSPTKMAPAQNFAEAFTAATRKHK